jgi:hypothetical protein
VQKGIYYVLAALRPAGRTTLLLPALLPQSLRAQLRSASHCPYGERQYPAQTTAASRTRHYRRRARTTRVHRVSVSRVRTAAPPPPPLAGWLLLQ